VNTRASGGVSGRALFLPSFKGGNATLRRGKTSVWNNDTHGRDSHFSTEGPGRLASFRSWSMTRKPRFGLREHNRLLPRSFPRCRRTGAQAGAAWSLRGDAGGADNSRPIPAAGRRARQSPRSGRCVRGLEGRRDCVRSSPLRARISGGRTGRCDIFSQRHRWTSSGLPGSRPRYAITEQGSKLEQQLAAVGAHRVFFERTSRGELDLLGSVSQRVGAQRRFKASGLCRDMHNGHGWAGRTTAIRF